MKHGWLSVVIGCVWLAGCESGSRLSPVDVVYKFSNVRTSASGDEWKAIQEILQKRSGQVVLASPVASRELGIGQGAGGVRVSSYRVKVQMPSLRSIDLVQEDLEDLAESGAGGQGGGINFSLTGVELAYDTNFVLAGTGIFVAGFAVPGARVELHPDVGVPAIRVTTDSAGRFSARLPGVPASGWVYGAAYDSRPGLPVRYFRIDVQSQKQEEVTPDDYRELFPPGEASKSTSTPAQPAPRHESASSPGEDELRRRAEQEDQAYRRMHEQEDAKWRQRK